MIERRTCTFDPSRVVSSFKSQGMEVLVSQAASIQVVQGSKRRGVSGGARGFDCPDHFLAPQSVH